MKEGENMKKRLKEKKWELIAITIQIITAIIVSVPTSIFVMSKLAEH